ncbi:hypothetical protein EDB85DRAFT_1890339 [Lactarius pseudohatsudake]|nr:hypothetical protein EDB85DRAFT_1890339 [Lactarius pseudohatsudake]
MRSLARPLLSDTQTRTGMAPPPPLRPHLCLRGNGKGPFDPPPLFLRKGGMGAGTVGPHLPPPHAWENPLPSPFCVPPCARLRAKGAQESLRANGELHGKGHTLPPLVCARAHDACRPPTPPFSVCANMSVWKGGHTRACCPRFAAPFPYLQRPIGTERERVRAHRPGPPPSAAAPSTRGKGACEGTRRPAQSPSLFGRGALYARKGSTRGHVTPCPVPPPPSAAAPCMRRKGAREGMRPPVPPFPICAEGGRTRARGPFLLGRAILYARRGAHEGTLPGNPLAASRYAWKRLTPMPVYAQRGCRKEQRAGVVHKPSGGAPRNWEEVRHPAQISAQG